MLFELLWCSSEHSFKFQLADLSRTCVLVDDGEDVFKEVFDDGEDIFEKVFNDGEDIFERVFDDI